MELDKLKEERSKANQETRLTAQKNKQAITDLKMLLAEAKKEKEARTRANTEVAKVKKQRLEVEAKVKENKARLEAAKTKLKQFDEKDNPLKLQEEIEALEWEQQTEASPVRERGLSKKISELRRRLPHAKEFQETYANYIKQREETHNANEEAKKLREQLVDHAEESEKHHQALLKATRKADSLQHKIAQGFKELDEKKQKADDIHFQVVEIRKIQWEEDRTEKQKTTQEERRKTQSIKQKLGVQAQKILEQFKAGKTISLEEMLILREAGVDFTQKPAVQA